MPAAAKGTKQVGSAKPKAAPGDAMEDRLLAFAEQLGTMVGTVQRRAEGWLDGDAVRSELSRIRDNASDLLEYVNSKAPAMPGARGAKGAVKRPAKARAASAPAKAVKATGRGPVDAPGKRHRQPPPQQRGNKRMQQPKGSQTAPALVKSVRRGGQA
jgi:hypothetical protein